jgi:serine O-acetyltransferase
MKFMTDTQLLPSTPDWSRESKCLFSWSPSRSFIGSIRRYQKYRVEHNFFYKPLKWIAIIQHHFWSAITGADIPLNAKIGGGLLMPHPNGIVIHPSAVIGCNCLIFQQVTIGERHGGTPTIGDHVDFGAGAKVIGKITIGNGAKIGANAVVLQAVPAFYTAVGVPAKIINIDL